MSDARSDAERRVQALEAELQALRAAYTALQEQFQKVQKDNAELRQALQRSERAAKRQAAPFSKNKPKSERKKPGRKAGEQHGRHGQRPAPAADAIDECHQAPLPDTCPHCGGGTFTDRDTAVQFQEDIPRQPLRRQFTIQRGTCGTCGRRVQGRHPLQTSDATGACGSQLGPDAQAAIVYYNKHAGLSYGKISDAFDKLHGLAITRGGCAHVVRRAGDRLEPALIEIHEQLRAAEHLTPDETGWRVGGQLAWLHTWVGDQGATAYAIDPQRGADPLIRLIGLHWSGTMTHDGHSAYDRFAEACHQQCVDHALRRARALVDKHPDTPQFALRIIAIFTDALAARDRHLAGRLSADDLYFWHRYSTAQLLEATASPLANDEERTFAQHLANHGEQWFLFLIDARTPATNHRAEQALKTPIVNRKVFGGNQTPAGARTQEVTSSVLQTCKNRAINFVGFVSQAFCGCVASLFA
jgi:transposase